ncbi:hypothetical protein PENTCL1PPCAC_12642, partial [Pristionchus entomophagus]
NWFLGVLGFVGISYIIVYLIMRWHHITPSHDFVEKVATKLNDRFHTDFRNVFFSGIDTTTKNASFFVPPSLQFLSSRIEIILSGTMIICGWRIQSTISKKEMSDRTRKLHRRVFMLIIFQALNPLFFIILPGVVPAVLVQFRLNSFELISWTAAYCMIIFPLANPIIMLVCTKAYR